MSIPTLIDRAAVHHLTPESRLSDREHERIAIETMDYLGLDLIASLDQMTNEDIGKQIRDEFERRVLQAVEGK